MHRRLIIERKTFLECELTRKKKKGGFRRAYRSFVGEGFDQYVRWIVRDGSDCRAVGRMVLVRCVYCWSDVVS